MKFRLNRHTVAAGSLVAMVSLAVVSLAVFRPAAAQNQAPAGKPACVGCSVDGKTTPRMPDGRPNLNGYWSNPQENTEDGSTAGDLATIAPDGSKIFDFGGPNNPQLETTFPNQAPYNAEYAPKVKAIADTMYGGATPLDPLFDCKADGVPRAG